MKTELQFFTDLEEAWEAMDRDCRRARHSIDFEQYMMLDDAIGRRFLTLFRDKAREGVKVRIVLDGIGSRAVRSSFLIDEIRQAGGTVRFYNSLRWWKLFFPARLFPRTHCKTLLIDSRYSYIGGVCIAEYMRDWRDLHIRISGDLAKTMHCGDLFGAFNAADPAFQYLVHQPRRPSNPIYNALVEQIDRARDSIYLCTPYFFPPLRLYKALKRAAERGVTVNIMLSQKNDVPFVMPLSRLYFSGLIAKGVNVVIYTKAVMHAKYAVIDDNWATLGSTNLDYLSLKYNKEGNIIITRRDLVARLKALFERDIMSCIQAETAMV